MKADYGRVNLALIPPAGSFPGLTVYTLLTSESQALLPLIAWWALFNLVFACPLNMDKSLSES